MAAIAPPENRYLHEKSCLLKILKDTTASTREKLEATKMLYLLKMQTEAEFERFSSIFGRRGSTVLDPPKEAEVEEEVTRPELPAHLK